MGEAFARFFSAHRAGVLDSIIAAAVIALLAAAAAWLKSRATNARTPRARTLAIVRDIYSSKSGWAPASDGVRTMVGGNYTVTNISAAPALITRVQGKVGRKRYDAAVSQ